MKGLRIILLFALIYFCLPSQAQVVDSTEDEPIVKAPPADTTVHALDWDKVKDNLVYGGSIGLQFYSPYTLFIISPQVGYKVRENTIVGAGVQMFGVTSRYNSYFQYGPDVFIRQHLAETFFAQAQFEYINFENYILPGKRIWNPGMLLGIGYGTYGYSLGIFTDLVQSKNSEYVYPGQIYIGRVPLFFRAQIFF